MNTVELRFLGAIGSVTGSCTHMRYRNSKGDELNYLIDAGVLQGEVKGEQAVSEIELIAKKLDGIFITHSHIDHIGLIPKLIDKGFQGFIYCTQAVKELTGVMLKDFVKVNKDLPYFNISQYEKMKFFIVDRKDDFQFGKTIHPIENNFRFGCLRTTHTLGSVAYYFQYKVNPEKEDVWKKVHFSGDLGPVSEEGKSTLISKEWQYPYFQQDDDYYILESTYGNRKRSLNFNPKARIEKLEEIISEAMGEGKHIIIPVFAQHRAQEVLFDLHHIQRIKKLRGPKYMVNTLIAQNRQLNYLWELSDGRTSSKSSNKNKTCSSQNISKIQEMIKSKWNSVYPEKELPLGSLLKDLDHNFCVDIIREINIIKETDEQRFFNIRIMKGIVQEVSKIYRDQLDDCKENEHGELKFKYLSKDFIEKFNLHDSNDVIILKNISKEIETCLSEDQIIQKDKLDNNKFLKIGTQVFLSAAGMCDEGGMLELLKQYHNRDDMILLLTGYQAIGTNGYLLKNLSKMSEPTKFRKKLNNTDIRLSEVKLDIIDISPYYSGHSDQVQLGEYISGEKHSKIKNTFRSNIFINHGNEESRESLKKHIESLSDKYHVELPKLNMFYNLSDGTISAPIPINEGVIKTDSLDPDDSEYDVKLKIKDSVLLFKSHVDIEYIRNIIEML